MDILPTFVAVAHVVFASLWTGAVVFVALLALRLSSGETTEIVELVVDRLRLVSRSSAVVTLLSGAYLAAGYSHAYFTSSTRGLLITAMVVLWIALMTSVEIGSVRLLDEDTRGTAILVLAGVFAVALLLDVGLLVAGV